MTNLQIGDRIVTPTGRTGTIAPSPYELPLYASIAFDDGTEHFILKEILKPYETSRENRSKPARNRRSAEKAGASGDRNLDGRGIALVFQS